MASKRKKKGRSGRRRTKETEPVIAGAEPTPEVPATDPPAEAGAYLRSRQLPDGSFEGDAYLTALAMQVLALDLPDLTVQPELVSVAPELPVSGDTATVSVTCAIPTTTMTVCPTIMRRLRNSIR